jgi:hypothetical protein
MDAILFFAGILIVPSIVALLAIHFGPDSRPGFHSDEHRLALRGMRWEARHLEEEPAAPEPSVHLVIGGDDAYPTLAVIDRSRGAAVLAFTTDPHAAALEIRARQLTNDYWPETTWLTGLIAPSMLTAVVSRLEDYRQTLRDEVRLFVATEVPARVV